MTRITHETDCSAARQLSSNELWLPGTGLDTEYPTPTNDQLRLLWQSEISPEAVETEEVFGIFSPPKRDVRAVMSVDQCEVTRQTVRTLHEVTGVPYRESIHYSDDTWFDSKNTSTDFERSVITNVLRVVMNAGVVRPVENIDEITSLLRKWRQNGVWVVANTSTLPGCEPGTITYTLGKSMQKQYDALILPRNHDGSGKMTKSKALKLLMKQAGIDEATPVVHIDDSPHHHNDFRELNGFASMKLIAPLYHQAVPEADIQAETPLKAFLAADKYISEVIN